MDFRVAYVLVLKTLLGPLAPRNVITNNQYVNSHLNTTLTLLINM